MSYQSTNGEAMKITDMPHRMQVRFADGFDNIEFFETTYANSMQERDAFHWVVENAHYLSGWHTVAVDEITINDIRISRSGVRDFVRAETTLSFPSPTTA